MPNIDKEYIHPHTVSDISSLDYANSCRLRGIIQTMQCVGLLVRYTVKRQFQYMLHSCSVPANQSDLEIPPPDNILEFK